MKIASNSLAGVLLAAHGARAAGLTVDVEDADSIKAAAALVAEDLMSYYNGTEPGNVPGILPEESTDGEGYYWWTGGLLWNTMLNYKEHTGETKYDSIISQGLQFQVGPNADFLPPNYTVQIGNDDQAIWALAALDAEVSGFTDPPAEDPQWLNLAKAVFDEQIQRRIDDDGGCDGALRWLLYPIETGYNYISSSANIGFFNLAAQLAHATSNQTYSDAASDAYDLLVKLGFVTDKFQVYDGAHKDEDCSDISKLQFSHTAAMLLQGSAFLYNHTDGNTEWKDRVDGLVDAILETFFPDGVAFEAACEKSSKCNTDMLFYKGILNHALGSTMKLAPNTADKILPVLKTSAKAAVAQCTGGDNGRMCGYHWSSAENDGTTGAGQQLSVLSALVNILPEQAAAAGNNSSASGDSANNNGGDSQNSTDGNTSNSDTPGSLGAKMSASLSALMGSVLLGAFLLA